MFQEFLTYMEYDGTLSSSSKNVKFFSFFQNYLVCLFKGTWAVFYCFCPYICYNFCFFWSKRQQFSEYGLWTPGCPKTFSAKTNYFYNDTKVFFTVVTMALIVQSNGQNGALTQRTTVASIGIHSHCVLHCHHTFMVKQKLPVSLNSVFDNSVKLNNDMKPWLLNTWLFNILCDKMRCLQKAFMLHW